MNDQYPNGSAFEFLVTNASGTLRYAQQADCNRWLSDTPIKPDMRLFACSGRELPILGGATMGDVRNWVNQLYISGLSFHFDDSPRDIVGCNFTEAECVFLEEQLHHIDNVCGLLHFDIHSIAFTLHNWRD